MSWQALGAIGELVGAIGVIATSPTSRGRAFADDFVAEVDRIMAEGTFDPPSREERLGRESVRQPDAATGPDA